MPVDSNSVANQAIILMGNNCPAVTGQFPNFDDSAAGTALNSLYGPCVQTVGRQHEWDMARNTIALTPSGGVVPSGWTYQFLYPTNGIEVWQLIDPANTDANNPLPPNWTVSNAVIAGQQQRVVNTNFASAIAVYNNNPNENTWDALFREAVVRLLASELAIAIGGRPDSAQVYLQSGAAFESIGQTRNG